MKPLRALALVALLGTFALAADVDARARPRGGLVVQEWGVWLVDRGAVTIDDLARESPSFVHRTRGVPPSATSRPGPGPRPPVIDRPPPTARKPVLFFHPDVQMRVRVQVGFRNGGPWLYFPGGVEAPFAGHPDLVFQGTVAPNGRGPLQRVARGHFFEHLREASDSVFLADGGEAEAFVFYDGPSEIARPSVARVGDAVTVRSADGTSVFVVASGRFVEIAGAPVATVRLPEVARTGTELRALEATIERQLSARGLRRPETTALLRTWRGELFESDAPRVISLPSRAAYDEALPIEITPRPSSLTRVGVVIERL